MYRQIVVRSTDRRPHARTRRAAPEPDQKHSQKWGVLIRENV